ncbi:unnamed protein product [Closterium sp. Yama58-4]|nr:unnamed protein product [Closterium sp. Yama58-4]
MASCAARHVAAVTTYCRNSSLRDSDADDSLEAILEAAFSAAVAVSSDATRDSAAAAAKTAAEAAACKAPVVLVRAGTLAARRKLKCGSLRLDVSLKVDDLGGAAVDVGVADLDGRRGIGGANDGDNDDHFSFETPPQAMLPAASRAVATATSPTVAWSSRGRQFRKSSSASSAPLSVADGSATNANDAASQADFSAAAAAAAESPHFAAAVFPRAASARAAYDKPPRSPLPHSVTLLPTSPPLGAQLLSPDAAVRHADGAQCAVSNKPQRRKRRGHHHHHHHPAEPYAAARQLAAPHAAARRLAELARGGLLSPVTPSTTFFSLARGFGAPRGSTAPSTPTGSSKVAGQSGDSKGDSDALIAGPRRVTGSGDEIAEGGLGTDGGKAGKGDNSHNEDDSNEAANWEKLFEEKPRTAGSNSGHLTAAAAAAAADDDDSDADVDAADDAGHESATPAKLPVRFLPLTHDMGDEELFWRASMVPLRRRSRARGKAEAEGGGGAGAGSRRKIGPAKVALLFYSAGTMPFAPLWARWLEGHEDRVSVYILTDETKIDKSLLPPIFRGRFVPNRSPDEPASADSKTVHMSTVDGMRRLLANALLDFANERFVTICELCIPIHNFTFVYSYLISPHHSVGLPSPSALFQPKSLTSSSGLHLAGTVPSAPRSYIPSNDVSGEGGRDRFNPNCFEPMLSVEQWRKGGQWIGLTRRLAVQVISDSKFYDKFAACCVPVKGVFPACFPSEHYLPSIIPILVDLPPVGDFGPFVDELWAGIGDGGGMGGGGRRSGWGEAAGGGGVGLRGSGEDLANWSLVFEDWWTQPNSGHPYVYNATELTPDLVSLMRHCHFGNLCHLFAGHFHPSALPQALSLGPKLGLWEARSDERR